MPALSDDARALLEELHRAGGCAFIRLPQVVHGFAPTFLTQAERLRLDTHLRTLERRGLIVIHRDWGTMGLGRPTWIEVTAKGAAAVASPGGASPGAASPGAAAPAAQSRTPDSQRPRPSRRAALDPTSIRAASS